MALIKFSCPKCAAENTLILQVERFSGPIRCWKCHVSFQVESADGNIVVGRELGEEEIEAD